MIAKIQASGDGDSQKFDAMHNHWGARDKANKALADQLAKTPKCARKAVAADEKPDEAKDAGEKADALEADAKANNCAVKEKKV